MRISKHFIAVAALLALSAGSAQAVVLYTAPAKANFPTLTGRTLYCDINNLTSHNVSMTVNIMDEFGGVTQTTGQFQLGPLQGFAISDFGMPGSFCQFIVNGGKNTVRALAIYDNGSRYTATIPAE